jgi:hypothetical protein
MTTDNEDKAFQAPTDRSDWSESYTNAWQDGYRAARDGVAPKPGPADGAEQAGYRQGLVDAQEASKVTSESEFVYDSAGARILRRLGTGHTVWTPERGWHNGPRHFGPTRDDTTTRGSIGC